MAVREILLDDDGKPAEVAEGDSAQLIFYIQDEAKVRVPVADLFSVKLTLTDQDSDDIIGLWDHRSVKNENGGTITEVVESGMTRTKAVVQLAPADHDILGSGRTEWRRALAEVQWNGGARGVSRVREYKVINIEDIT
jgi:hypothetical protein